MTPEPLRRHDPARLGRYVLIGLLGQGGQGAVYLGESPDGERVAVKLLRADLSSDPEARSRFAREVTAAKRVAKFCTAQVLDADITGDQPYVVSEYVQGRSLYNLVATNGPLTGGALDRLAIGTATALAAIHAVGIVHRDFKPANVMMGPDGPRVIDFGIARALDATATASSMVIGTPAYMAPEQFAPVYGESADGLADIFAWASTTVFAATGKPPFGSDTAPAIMHRVLVEPPDLAGMPAGRLRDLVEACLAKDRTARPSAHELMQLLLGHADFPRAAQQQRAGDQPPQHPRTESAAASTPPVPTDSDNDRARSVPGLPSRRRRLARRSASVAVAAVVGLLSAVFIAPRFEAPVRGALNAQACSGTVRVAVAAAPEIAPTLRTFASELGRDKTEVGGKCLQLEVAAASPGKVFDRLSRDEPTADDPDLWVPDSSEWTRREGLAPDRTRVLSRSIASSPVVLATARAAARKLATDRHVDNWAELASASRMAVGEDATSAVTFAALLGIRRSAGDASPQQAAVQFGKTLGSLSRTERDLGAELRAVGASGGLRGVAATEQQVHQVTATDPDADVTAVVPKLGTVMLDYPLVAVADDPDVVESATVLTRHLSGMKARAALQRAGFRTPSGAAPPKGSSVGSIKALQASSAADGEAVRRSWLLRTVKHRVLMLMDVSQSMAYSDMDSSTRVEQAVRAAKGVLAELPPDVKAGLWTFAGRGGIPSEIDAQVETLDAAHRSRLTRILDRLPGSVRPDSDTLNLTTSFAYSRALWDYEPDRANWLIVLTDGEVDENWVRETADGEVHEELRSMREQAKPIEVLLVGIGPGANMPRLRRTATAAGGTAVHAINDAEAGTVIADAMLRRCRACR